ncbi:polysaccharide biosynthesis protein [Octadecabacter ascidiaceicola]|uniref:UDP-N-acetyl-alpha-D-glucosamine C6 dehydratase n=1 Tax=Octadecabacter ascidiaceicola TaxID=1655543 RepID=A0A238KQW4_9RHOB|nr:nucleoside-diphosphate sugar epimerase/dehydratase [Octadecabacter ascidiaceicola]SMX45203.1 UDP-N-acetyl-alpha-D-glucosamine C6 dehydratase [Octadecabacter ascidiaceicola]
MLNALPRRMKRMVLLTADILLVPIALYAAYVLRYGTAVPFERLSADWPILLTTFAAAPFIIVFCRLPWIKLSTLDFRGALRIAAAAGILAIIASLASVALSIGSPRSIPGIFAVSFFILSFFGRVGAILGLQQLAKSRTATPVAIFGAGAAGIQLSSALRQSPEVVPVCFVDDDPSYRGLNIAGLRVRSRDGLKRMVANGQVSRVLVAIPSMDQAGISRIVEELGDLGVEIQVLPSFVDLISGRSKELKLVAPEALLGREKVNLDLPVVAKSYAGRTVMVTGAGGSIGSELCKQLLECNPERIVLFEQSEYALYEVEAALRAGAAQKNVEVVARLGSVCDRQRVDDVLQNQNVEIVLHAAAYKHVPLIEENEIEGARNNILGTKTLAEAAMAAEVERFILVSTDKAVRPTNIMGATKRLAELVLQDLATRSVKTRFSMVRFGNVLGSSGSVLPLFQKQIRHGGPVTVTHPDVTRFFMTIPEASRLVLLAGAFSKGGDVFVLDMGKPMRIIDIARRMIEMSGATVQSPTNPGGIEIKVTGLRPGEKLYEELLIDNASLTETPHEKILRAEEEKHSEIMTARMLMGFEAAVDAANTEEVRALVAEYASGYHIPDHAEPAKA